MANIIALAIARRVKLRDHRQDGVVYCSDQTHSSVDRGLRILGFRDDQVRRVLSDNDFRLDVARLRRAVEEDRVGGSRPFCVVANAGTTNTGAVDPLPELADYCQQEGLWLHVDGAYGASAALCQRGRVALDGLGRADSLALDPHKWLFQPYEIGCVLVRNERWLSETFCIKPEYLQDLAEKTGEVNFCDRGIQLTRGFRALKLWMSLQIFGASAFEGAQNRGFELAEAAEAMVRKLPDWEVVTPAQMAIVTFRYAPQGMTDAGMNQFNRSLVDEMMADGFAMLSSTVLRGMVVLRMCAINPRTTETDVQETVRRLDEMARRSYGTW